MRLYLSEKISFWPTLRLFLQQLLYRRCSYLICFDSPGTIWRCLLATAGISRIDVAATALGDMTNERGLNLYWDYDERILAATEHALAEIDLLWLAGQVGESADIMHVFLTRAVFADYYDTGRRLMTLRGNGLAVDAEQRYLLVEHTPFLPYHRQIYADAGLAVMSYPRFGALAALAREAVAIVKSMLLVQLKPGHDEQAAPCVAVQYVAGLNPDGINDLPWFESSGLQPRQILIYTNDQHTADAVAAARRRGFLSTDFWRWRIPRSLGARYAADMRKAIRIGMQILSNRRLGSLAMRVWLARCILQFMRRESRWRAFFAAHNVVLHFHASDSNALAVTAPVALAKSGGRDFACQLGGNGELAFEFRALTGRTLLAWGDYHRRLHEALNRRIPGKGPASTIIVGHQHDHLLAARRTDAASLRETLKSHGVTFIVTAFDNVAMRDFLITPTQLERFYGSLIKIAAADPSVGVVMKRKPGQAIVLPASLSAQLASLQEAGRWIELPVETSVFEAALSADVAVILHMASAGMETAIANIPHIYYDLTAWGDHPFYVWRQDLVATTHDELTILLNRHRSGDGFGPGHAEYERYRLDISPYSDHCSARRIGAEVRAAFSKRVPADAHGAQN